MSMFNGKLKPEVQAQTSSSYTNGNGNGYSSGSSSSVIAAGTIIKGDITSNADIRIEGTLTGNITCASKVIIGASGLVDGDIIGQQADIHGKISGIIKVKDLLQLKGDCIVQGNIFAGKLQVEPSATFNGECHMVSTTTESNTLQIDPLFEE